jgi:membrane-associated phospholipid phosphatase
MGMSRLYVGDHWLTDVLAAYAVAGAVVAAVAWVTGPFLPTVMTAVAHRTRPTIDRG